ncbi:MAG: hypothetical protein KVP17_004373 [Porospora cf. gigantea B]|nr:MAG: hypothetical protein KVP17_004373 [Porospora cf. gigantea B]
MKYCPLRRKYQTVIPRMEGLLELKYLVDGQVLCSGSLDRCIDKNDPTKLNNIVYVKPVDPKLKAVRNCRKIVRSFANKKHSLPCGPLPEVDQPLQDKLWSAAPGLKHKPPRRLMSRMSSQQAGERDARIKHMLLDGRRNAARMLHSHSGRVTAAEDISPVTLPTENVQSDRCGFVSSPEAAEQSNVDDEVAPVRTCRSAGRTCGLGQRAPIVQVMARRAPIGEPAQDDVKESHDREAAVYSICEDDSRQTPIADREAAVYSICEDDVRQTPIAHPEAAIDLIHQDDVRQTSIINREAGIAQAEIRQTSTTDQQAAKAAVTEAAIKQGTVTDSSHIELAAHEAVVLASGALTTADRIGCEVMELDVPSDTDPREGYDDPLNTATTTAGSLSHLEASETAGNVVTRRGDSSRRRKRKRNKKSSEKSTPLQQRTPTASVTEPVTPERPPLSPPVHSLTQPASPLRGGSLSPALLFGRQSPNSMGPRSDDGSYTRLSTFGSYDTRFHRTFFLDEEDPVLHRLYIQRKEQIERRHRQGRRHR